MLRHFAKMQEHGTNEQEDVERRGTGFSGDYGPAVINVIASLRAGPLLAIPIPMLIPNFCSPWFPMINSLLENELAGINLRSRIPGKRSKLRRPAITNGGTNRIATTIE